eukprot:TRINITY_DN14833_c0_g1_i1.p1 TRINITY_DN14833_c0_g1~~TRINITY_DN14833_c0_g1_i1.p1  ORF type:complete len:454 (+),score=106.17 TRINITY_DN14833_c0_g1_i1:45-1364(+)
METAWGDEFEGVVPLSVEMKIGRKSSNQSTPEVQKRSKINSKEPLTTEESFMAFTDSKTEKSEQDVPKLQMSPLSMAPFLSLSKASNRVVKRVYEAIEETVEQQNRRREQFNKDAEKIRLGKGSAKEKCRSLKLLEDALEEKLPLIEIPYPIEHWKLIETLKKQAEYFRMFKVSWRAIDRKMILEVVVGRQHQTAENFMTIEIGVQLSAPAIRRTYEVGPSGTINVLNAAGVVLDTMEADSCIIPRGRALPPNNVYPDRGINTPSPSVIIEITSSTLSDSLNKALRWITVDTEIEMVLVITYWNLYGNGKQSMLALAIERGAMGPAGPGPTTITQAISFGNRRLHIPEKGASFPGMPGCVIAMAPGVHVTGGKELIPPGAPGYIAPGMVGHPARYPKCTAAANAAYALTIPAARLAQVPAAAANVVLDLWFLQQDLLAV